MAGSERGRLLRLKDNLQKRALIIDGIRTFFRDHDFLEVETPVRMPSIAPEVYIEPVESGDWFLATSPELHMKRLLAAGYERIFQLSRCFRRGERGRLHNPEFTMLEWYRAGADYEDIIRDTEELVLALAGSITDGHILRYQNSDIDLAKPWPRVTVRDVYLREAGWDPVSEYDGLRFDTDFLEKVQPSFATHCPTVIVDYPAAAAALARLKPGDERVAERAEVFIGGLELANIYSELVDRTEQEKRFREDIETIRRTRKAPPISSHFMEALDYLPECGGVALGVDRLVMLLCNTASIDEAMAFTSDTA